MVLWHVFGLRGNQMRSSYPDHDGSVPGGRLQRTRSRYPQAASSSQSAVAASRRSVSHALAELDDHVLGADEDDDSQDMHDSAGEDNEDDAYDSDPDGELAHQMLQSPGLHFGRIYARIGVSYDSVVLTPRAVDALSSRRCAVPNPRECHTRHFIHRCSPHYSLALSQYGAGSRCGEQTPPII